MFNLFNFFYFNRLIVITEINHFSRVLDFRLVGGSEEADFISSRLRHCNCLKLRSYSGVLVGFPLAKDEPFGIQGRVGLENSGDEFKTRFGAAG